MLGKPDWPGARSRWTALWEGRYDRRPCMVVKARRPDAPPPPPPPVDPWRRWIDPEWVPGAGAAPNGPAWLDLYRRVQRAGRIVHVNLPPESIEPLVCELDPALVCYATWCRSPAEAEELLSAAAKWVGARSRAARAARATGGATGRRSGPPCRP